MDKDEFDLIEQIKAEIKLPSGMLGIGDDCAILPQQTNMQTLVSTDMLIEGQHFLLDKISPYQLGWKSAAVNISDIAAMGGRATASFLSISLPKSLDSIFLGQFIRGYLELSDRFNCTLLGGDTTSSPSLICINVTVLGTCEQGKALKRSGAKPGDIICVTGTLGDSAAGLKQILEQKDYKNTDFLIKRHLQPIPRVEYGLELATNEGVHSMMDISDGIASDLRHILKASGVGAQIDCSKLPLSEQLRQSCELYGWDALELALEGGEDYELLFTAYEYAQISVPHTVIGRITEGSGIAWQGAERDYMGFRHF